MISKVDSEKFLLRHQARSQSAARNERGASLVEYALLVALIAVVAIAAIRILGRTVSNQFSTVQAQMAG